MALHQSDATEAVAKRAAKLSMDWRHYYLSCEHYLAAAVTLDAPVRNWLASKGLDYATLETELIELLPMGDEKVPQWNGTQSPRLKRLLGKPAQEIAESCRAMRVEPKHVVAAFLTDPKSIPSRLLVARGVDLRKAGGELLGGVFPSVSAPSSGDGISESRVSSSGEGREKKKKEKMLSKYARDLVAQAREGKIDPVVGRADEIRRMLTILTRKTKSNPVITGEAGVGKTAVVLGLAQRIAEGTVPDQLKDARLLELSLTSMLAGAKHRGEFEERLQGVMDEVAEDKRIILFIDELHQLVGAGDSRGGMDASNILKPALARGDFPLIGATTTDEYRKSIEADPALERRFQPVLVGEPSEEDALTILQGLKARYEGHHGVKIADETLLAAVKLSVRYLPDRNLPDKALDLIDEAAARVKNPSGIWSQEDDMKFVVTPEVVASVVSDWTGIPVSRMTTEETQRLLEMESLLEQRVVGQNHACKAVADTIRVVRMGLVSPTRPGGVFFFLGPSGVGKTELAKGLAEFLFGSDKEIVRLDMSEFHDKHTVTRLVGSPPGYVGHDEEGQLTGAVRTKPYCVVLLDEVEKAHPEVFDHFLQVFDDGRLTDSKGRTVNFTNTIIVMTSNLGSRDAAAAGERGFAAGQLETLPAPYQKALRGHFRPEFLNRIDEIVVFKALDKDDLTNIVQLQLEILRKQALEKQNLVLSFAPDAVELLIEKGYQPEFGARPMHRAINQYLKRPLAEEALRNQYAPGTRIEVVRMDNELGFEIERPSAMEGTVGAH